jgi:metal-responsive CopG/Arc/MetJ family transcriptional regulator
MKTAISIPDWLYREAEKTAKNLGIPRSRLFALALEEYLRRQGAERITAKLNSVHARISADTSATQAGVSALRTLTGDDTW